MDDIVLERNYKIIYKMEGSEHPFNYWLHLGNDEDGYPDRESAIAVINDLGMRMQESYGCNLLFKLVITTTTIETEPLSRTAYLLK